MSPDLSTSLLHAVLGNRPVPAWAGVVLQVAITAMVFLPLLSAVAMIGIWAERKISARIQSRIGPNRVGPFGLWQSLADGAKMLLKEDLVPTGADGWLFRLAPYLAFVPVFTAYAAIPFGPELTFEPHLSAGVFWLLAILSVEAIGVILAGWSSNNKWSVYGGVREACQMVCYEIPLGLSIIIGVMTAGTLSLVRMGLLQGGGIQTWLVFRNPFSLAAFVVYFIASLAANKRAPFDLPEGDSELVAGYHTEYSGMRFGLFFLAEYAAMFVVAAIQTALFLGGWNDPFGLIGFYHQRLAGGSVWPLLALNGVAAAIFLTKCSLLVLVQMWVRWTFPRPRIDQVLYACVKVLLPLACVLLLGAATWQLFLPERAGVPWVDYQPWDVGDWTRQGLGAAWFVQVILGGGAVVFAVTVIAFIVHAFLTGRADHRRLYEAEPILAPV
jgi:NADH-quinone oxidoreductase subunit H